TVFCHGLICLISSNSIIRLLENLLHKGPGIRDHSGKMAYIAKTRISYGFFRVLTAKENA
ncbi:MAG: hypothetical protein ACLSTC_13450, partial [Lachnospiraceae bacterium]